MNNPNTKHLPVRSHWGIAGGSFAEESKKIDRSFVNSIGQTMEGASLVADMIRMAHGQGLKVVAEGVETEEQLGFLREANCDLYQGFLMSPAVPLGELVEMIEIDMGRDIA